MYFSRSKKHINFINNHNYLILEGLVWGTNVAAVSLFRDTNLTGMASFENQGYLDWLFLLCRMKKGISGIHQLSHAERHSGAMMTDGLTLQKKRGTELALG